MTYVVPLAEAEDPGRVGKKASALGRLLRAGFEVPRGFVITADAFEGLLPMGGTGALLKDAAFPTDVAREIRAATAAYHDTPLAVRSSSNHEDLDECSFAGQYATFLDVSGEEAVLHAALGCWRSGLAEHMTHYLAGAEYVTDSRHTMAVLVQPMVRSKAAGVALTANPVTGDPDSVLVSAVPGALGPLVSGTSGADEWLIRGDEVTVVREMRRAVDEPTLHRIAEIARQVQSCLAGPQDIEWALTNEGVVILQARPLTAIPRPRPWRAPISGYWSREWRLGEWLSEPVTPLFRTWLLQRLEARIHDRSLNLFGIEAPRPPSVVVNGWYYLSLNFLPSTREGVLRLLLWKILPRMLLHPRRTSVFVVQLAWIGAGIYVREWKDRLLPRYRRIVEAATRDLKEMNVEEIPALIDTLAEIAGDYFSLIPFVAGQAWKAELALGRFWADHLGPLLPGSYQSLLTGLHQPLTSFCGT
jgi:rifampicin phosphotransferase